MRLTKRVNNSMSQKGIEMKTLDAIKKAKESIQIIAGFNVFGYEDALEIVRAAENAQQSVLLMTNRDACRAMEVEHWGALLSSIARKAKVPVGVHLDHCSDREIIIKAIENGYTSVMYDGSKLSIDENINNTKEIVSIAHKHGVFVEGEVGCVPYNDKAETKIEYTLPEEAKRLEQESGLDMLAISVGNVHRLTDTKVNIKFDLLREIEAASTVPLVIHGASGINQDDFIRLKEHGIGKINIGTVLRQEFGKSLREEFSANSKEFDRLKLMEKPRELVFKKALEIIKSLK